MCIARSSARCASQPTMRRALTRTMCVSSAKSGPRRRRRTRLRGRCLAFTAWGLSPALGTLMAPCVATVAAKTTYFFSTIRLARHVAKAVAAATTTHDLKIRVGVAVRLAHEIRVASSFLLWKLHIRCGTHTYLCVVRPFMEKVADANFDDGLYNYSGRGDALLQDVLQRRLSRAMLVQCGRGSGSALCRLYSRHGD